MIKDYKGFRELNVDLELINEINVNKIVDYNDNFFPNEFVILKHNDLETITRYKNKKLVLHKHPQSILSPKNREQKFALELLHDESVQLLTLIGPAGVGKSLLTIAAGKQQLEKKKYSRMLVSRPIVPLGKDLGYLPGTIKEKMDPWIAPIRDNISFLLDLDRSRTAKKQTMKHLFDNDIIEIEAIPYIRGRTLPNTFMIIDEAQNLDLQTLKTIITRAGEGTKIVLTGDLEQTDTKINPGLPILIEKFKNEKIAGHLQLIKGERSELATIASNIL